MIWNGTYFDTGIGLGGGSSLGADLRARLPGADFREPLDVDARLEAFSDSDMSPEVVARVWAETGGSIEGTGAEDVADEFRAEEETAREPVAPADTAESLV